MLFYCEDCNKPNEVNMDTKGKTVQEVRNETNNLQKTITESCDCKVLKENPVVSVKCTTMRHSRYELTATLKNGGSEEFLLPYYTPLETLAGVKKKPSWKKVNDFLKTEEGLRLANVYHAITRRDEHISSLQEELSGFRYSLGEAKMEELVEFGRHLNTPEPIVLELEFVEEQSGFCRTIFREKDTKNLFCRFNQIPFRGDKLVNHWCSFFNEPDSPLKDGVEIFIGDEHFKIKRDGYYDWAVEVKL